ncbi:hypothetical protein [Paraflavitalea speifideaquila]|uniref:hypothetical protein n=1 Tax=Paraflavitalea speifideaquila TaxID=3076558 RepID=UPI0028E49456|nr:hypothetical protein [Paraflavitalea speifideiaquila]
MNKQLYLSLTSLTVLVLLIISCEKDFKADENQPPPIVSRSYKESFDTVGNISKKDGSSSTTATPSAPWPGGRGVLNMVANWAMK